MTQAKIHAALLSRRQLFPLYAAGFTTAFGAHAVAANLGNGNAVHADAGQGVG